MKVTRMLRSNGVVLTTLLLATSWGCGQDARDLSAPSSVASEEEEGDGVPVPELTAEERAKLAMFVEPDLSIQQLAAVRDQYREIDPNDEVPNDLLERALAYYRANRDHIDNDNYLTVIDFAARSSRSRLFVIDMTSGDVWSMHVAHGTGSDRNDDGYAETFGNVPDSKKSSIGFYRTAETYESPKNGYSLRLDGLSSSNSNVRSRAIVMHGAAYVYDSNAKPGLSWGCPAVSRANRTRIINKLKGGSVIYANLSE